MLAKVKYFFVRLLRILNLFQPKKFLNRFFRIVGFFSFLFFVLSFTDIPFYAYHWLGVSNIKLSGTPNTIVILGGSGMPSPDGLIRTYYAAESARQFTDAEIIIALPFNQYDSLHQLELMAHELIVKGIDSTRIKFEPLGYNTHSQAVNIAKMYGTDKRNISLLIITTPEHMYRSIKTFRKVGFSNVGGNPTFEKPIDEEMAKDKENSEDTRVKSLDLRYNMWSYLNYELLVMREYFAILYYKLKGWV